MQPENNLGTISSFTLKWKSKEQIQTVKHKTLLLSSTFNSVDKNNNWTPLVELPLVVSYDFSTLSCGDIALSFQYCLNSLTSVAFFLHVPSFCRFELHYCNNVVIFFSVTSAFAFELKIIVLFPDSEFTKH